MPCHRAVLEAGTSQCISLMKRIHTHREGERERERERGVCRLLELTDTSFDTSCDSDPPAVMFGDVPLQLKNLLSTFGSKRHLKGSHAIARLRTGSSMLLLQHVRALCEHKESTLVPSRKPELPVRG